MLLNVMNYNTVNVTMEKLKYSLFFMKFRNVKTRYNIFNMSQRRIYM